MEVVDSATGALDFSSIAKRSSSKRENVKKALAKLFDSFPIKK